MKKIVAIFAILVMFTACNKAVDAPVIVNAVENSVFDLNAELPELSIYNLPSTWTNQDGQDLELQELRGKVLVMVMVYTSCKAACPRLVADMRNIEKQVPAADLDKVKFI